MPIIDLPVAGEQPWDAKLNTAINTINGAVDDLEDDAVTSTSVDLIVSITRTAYNALGTKVATTLYLIDETA